MLKKPLCFKTRFRGGPQGPCHSGSWHRYRLLCHSRDRFWWLEGNGATGLPGLVRMPLWLTVPRKSLPCVFPPRCASVQPTAAPRIERCRNPTPTDGCMGSAAGPTQPRTFALGACSNGLSRTAHFLCKQQRGVSDRLRSGSPEVPAWRKHRTPREEGFWKFVS